MTVYSVLEVDQHPLPNPEELFVELSGGEKFSELDLSRAYQLIILDEDCREYVTINTHNGYRDSLVYLFGYPPRQPSFNQRIEQVF